MKTLKKITAIALVVLLIVSATSCFSRGSSIDNGSVNDQHSGENNYAPTIKDDISNGEFDKEDNSQEDHTNNNNGIIANPNTPDQDKNPGSWEENFEESYPTDFEGDIVIGSQYFDGENIASVNNLMHFLNTKDNNFVLDSIEILTGMKSGTQKSGKFTYDGNTGIYTLNCDDGSVSYGKIDGALFMYCNKDGSPIDTVTGRLGDGVTEIAIQVRPGNSDYGYRDLSKNKNGDEMQKLYRDLLNIYEDMYDSSEDITAEGDRYILARLELSKYKLSIDEMVSVWKIFGLENPAYYYFNNTLFVEDSKLVLSIDADYAKASDRAKYKSDINAMVAECAQALAGKNSQLLRSMAIHDYIVTEINYAYKSDGKTPEDAAWAHNIIGTASKKMGVCETYAKTFQYLCLINGIDAITLSGYGGEPHGWNLVKIDGKWYGVDATWNDTGDNSKLSYDCFGMSFNNMTATHTHDMPTSHGVTYLYDIPTVSNYDIQLVTLYKNGESLGMFCGIDDTFGAMTDKNADYIIELFNYTDSGPLLLSTPTVQHYVFSSKTPDVKSISLEGTYKHFEGGYIVVTPIFLANNQGFTVTSDFSIKDMEFFDVDFFNFPGLFIENSKLILSGGCCESEIAFIGRTENDVSSTIVSNASEINIYSDLDIYRIEAGPNFEGQQSHITLRGSSKVDEVELSILNLTALGRSKSEIGKFIGTGEYPTITFDNTEAIIGDIIVEDDVEDVCLSMKFGDLVEVSRVQLKGSVNAPIEFTVDGQKVMQSTDVFGNVLEDWKEIADPLDIEGAFFTINESIDIDSISILFIEWRNDGGGYHTDKTALYELNSKYEFVMGDVIRTDDYIIKGDTLIRYTGKEEIPTIPSGIKKIAPYAFFDCDFISAIVLPEGVTTVGAYAFMFCINMKSLSLPVSLAEFDYTLFGFGSKPEEISGSYAGSVAQWRKLVMRVLADSDYSQLGISTITCRDGDTAAGSAFPRNSDYPEYAICDVWYHYQDYEGFGMACFVFQYNNEGKAEIRRCVYLDNREITGTSVSHNGFPLDYQYDAGAGVYCVDVNGKPCYIKLTDTGFVFCDVNGNTLAELPEVLR